jgi:hypothetical protein
MFQEAESYADMGTEHLFGQTTRMVTLCVHTVRANLRLESSAYDKTDRVLAFKLVNSKT